MNWTLESVCNYFASATSNKCCNNLILRCGAASTSMNDYVTFTVWCWIITILVCCKLVWSPCDFNWLPGLYGLKFGNLIACRSFLHLNSYNLVGSVTSRSGDVFVPMTNAGVCRWLWTGNLPMTLKKSAEVADWFMMVSRSVTGGSLMFSLVIRIHFVYGFRLIWNLSPSRVWL